MQPSGWIFPTSAPQSGKFLVLSMFCMTFMVYSFFLAPRLLILLAWILLSVVLMLVTIFGKAMQISTVVVFPLNCPAVAWVALLSRTSIQFSSRKSRWILVSCFHSFFCFTSACSSSIYLTLRLYVLLTCIILDTCRFRGPTTLVCVQMMFLPIVMFHEIS